MHERQSGTSQEEKLSRQPPSITLVNTHQSFRLQTPGWEPSHSTLETARGLFLRSSVEENGGGGGGGGRARGPVGFV
jgi:hypothetical protein